VKKIKEEVAKEIVNAISAKINDCFLNVYIAIANKIEQINKGSKNNVPETTEVKKDNMPIKKNIKYTHHLSFFVATFILLTSLDEILWLSCPGFSFSFPVELFILIHPSYIITTFYDLIINPIF
jgi:hypothetical protein